MSFSDKKSIITDSSSLILLYKASLVDVFIHLYTVCVPYSVFSEITQKDHTGSEHFLTLSKNDKLHITNNEIYYNVIGNSTLNNLGCGERDVICEYLHGDLNFAVLDDKKGIKYCYNNSIPFINAILACRIMYLNNSIDSALYRKSLNTLSSVGRYSEKIKVYAKNAGISKLKEFMP